MKRTALLLLAGLLLALRTVAQAPEKAAPDDLVVTAEIVGYSKQIVYPTDSGKSISRRKLRQYLKQPLKRYVYFLQAKMVVRNTTNHPRTINFMICDWARSWIASTTSEVFEPTFLPGCDKNYPAAMTIPAGEAIIFRCPLNGLYPYPESLESYSGLLSIRLGFVDLKLEDFEDIQKVYGTSLIKRIQSKELKSRPLYWSNVINDKIDASTAKEFTGYGFPWGVTWNDEYWPTWRDE